MPERNEVAPAIGPDVMGELKHILARLPERELVIRRRLMTDEGFRALCSDYEEAAQALEHWQHVAETAPAGHIVADYVDLLAALEAEIIAGLDRGARRG